MELGRGGWKRRAWEFHELYTKTDHISITLRIDSAGDKGERGTPPGWIKEVRLFIPWRPQSISTTDISVIYDYHNYRQQQHHHYQPPSILYGTLRKRIVGDISTHLPRTIPSSYCHFYVSYDFSSERSAFVSIYVDIPPDRLWHFRR